jgi:hypothetical protein
VKKKLSDDEMKRHFQDVLKHIYCLHCRKNVPLVDIDAWVDQGGVVLRGKCGLCGAEISRFVEVR